MAEQYPNRTDLQNPTQKVAKMAATGQAYGEAGKQLAAQSAVPMGASPADNAAPQLPQPGQLGDLTRGTERPQEPDTAGMPFGPGVGPEVFGAPMNGNIGPGSIEDLIHQVRYIYSKYPNSAVLQLMMDLENQPIT